MAKALPPGSKIGLEVHCYVATRTKMFCACPNRFWDSAVAPNTLLCPVCTSQPGAKPLPANGAALEKGLQLAHVLGCAPAADEARFVRKHYFYPDLPSNYQRTSRPFARGGQIAGVPITEIHWEEDPGAYDPRRGTVDFNRSGAPLLELVTEPEVRDPAHAREVLEELRMALEYLGLLSPAGMKADANISLAGGARVEVKNLNSARNVELALEHEAQRQAEVLAGGGKVARETRHFDETFVRTESLRAKESDEDYRYLPDPDLPAIAVAPLRATVASSMPPNPFDLRERWQRDLGVTREAANVLLAERGLTACFLALQNRVPAREAFEFLVGDFKRELNFRGQAYAASGVGAEELETLLAAHAGGLPRARGVQLLRLRFDHGAEAFRAALAREGATGVASEEVEAAIVAAMGANPKAVEDFRKGRAEAANRIMGDAMKRLQGRAPPGLLRERILALLEADPKP